MSGDELKDAKHAARVWMIGCAVMTGFGILAVVAFGMELEESKNEAEALERQVLDLESDVNFWKIQGVCEHLYEARQEGEYQIKKLTDENGVVVRVECITDEATYQYTLEELTN